MVQANEVIEKLMIAGVEADVIKEVEEAPAAE
jgi:hypothetical protein